MRDTDIVDFLVDVEDRHPVDEWQIDGVAVWPLARLNVGWQLTQVDHGGEEQPRSARLSTARPLAAHASAFVHDVRHQDTTHRKAQVVFLGDSVSRVRLGDAWYDPHCDPLIECCRGMGYSTLHVEPFHHYRAPRSNRAIWIQHRLDAIRRLRRSSPR